jgi:hypothetical protein
MKQGKRRKPTPLEKLRHIETLTEPGPIIIENQRKILTAIKEAALENYVELETAVNSRPLSTAAWLSRNLLELALWSEYCHRSPFNAQQFMLDAARDGADALRVIRDHREGPPTPGITHDELVARGMEDGFLTITDRFTEVGDVAEFLGRGSHFKYWNKILSKFAHPTAFALATEFKELEDSFEWADAVVHYADAVLNRPTSGEVNR